jgi:hypothetical protein
VKLIIFQRLEVIIRDSMLTEASALKPLCWFDSYPIRQLTDGVNNSALQGGEKR